jgi:hypothetical protein
MKQWIGAAAVAALVTAAAHAQPVGETETVGVEDLKTAYREADQLILFEVESVQANTTVAIRQVWEVRGPVLEVIKGDLLPGRVSVHVESVVRSFRTTKSDVVGRRFLVPLKPMAPATERRFQLVGRRAFEVESAEAKALRELAESDLERGAGGEDLALSVRLLEKVFKPEGPKMIEVRLTNEGTESATYLQAPLTQKEGRLYLMGQGRIVIRNVTGEVMPDKGNVVRGQAPPPPPTPALILPKASFVETVDLDQYFELPIGRYTMVVILSTPDGRGQVPSPGISFQVGAVDLPEAPMEPEPIGIRSVETTPAPASGGPAEGEAENKVNVPEPDEYRPGKTVFGLMALLRPEKSHYVLGEPIELELRLINRGPMVLVADARLERTLTLQVAPVGDSPAPLFIRQIIPWPEDGEVKPEARAYLREGAFWGRKINLNTLYGKSLDQIPAPTPKEIAAGKDHPYERFARNLFGFPRPGAYRVTARYQVERPEGAGGSVVPGKANWWHGDLESNSVTIQILPPRAAGGAGQ